jgi:molybdopterin-containing oxidoreductase family membrane subunit
MNTKSCCLGIVDMSWRAKLGLLLWLLFLSVGLFGLWERMTTGHTLAGYGSYVPWGLWVALYFHGAGLAAGVFIIGVLGFLTDASGYKEKGELRRIIVLSTAVLLPGLWSVGLDLGRMERGLNIFLSPGFTSMMTINAWLYQIYIFVMLAAWLLSWRRSSDWLKPFLLLGIVLSAAFALGSGLFFGAIKVKPEWYGAVWPLLTIVSAITTGSALLLLLHRNPVDSTNGDGAALPRRIAMVGIPVYFGIDLLHKASESLYPGGSEIAAQTNVWLAATSIPGWIPWVFGGVLPFLLLSSSRRSGWRLAGFLVAFVFIAGRLKLVLAGQPPLDMPALVSAFQSDRLVFAYQATAMELRVALLLVALGVAIYVVGGWINLTITTLLKAKTQIGGN